jgi:archaemetzincin
MPGTLAAIDLSMMLCRERSDRIRVALRHAPRRIAEMTNAPTGKLPLARREMVLIVPIDGPPAGEIVQLVGDLWGEDVQATLGEAIALPAKAYDRGRDQYRAEELLATVREHNGRRVLGVTAHDVFTEGRDFAFGVADPGGHAAMISLFRLRLKVDEATFRARALKEVIHQLGRTFGLDDCPNRRCVMHFASLPEDIDRKSKGLCETCLLRASLHG